MDGCSLKAPWSKLASTIVLDVASCLLDIVVSHSLELYASLCNQMSSLPLLAALLRKDPLYQFILPAFPGAIS